MEKQPFSAANKLTRYTLGVGIGSFALGLMFGWPWQDAGFLAGLLVFFGWMLWGYLGLADEYQTVAKSAVEFAYETFEVIFPRIVLADISAAAEEAMADDELESLDPEVAPRLIRVNDKNGAHWMAIGTETSYRRRVMSFLILGERVGSFYFRNMQGRSLSDGTRLDYSLWRRVTDDLVRAHLFVKQPKKGTRPVGAVTDVVAKVSSGTALVSEPLSGEIIFDPAQGFQQ